MIEALPQHRVCFFIDGFNFYHSLAERPDFRKYLWLDYAKLARLFVTRREVVRRVLYFTAYPTWNETKAGRHRHYVSALRTQGVEPVLGKFKLRSKECRNCRKPTHYHEEKETDVNIAVELFKLAIADEYDVAYLVSGDTDLVPAVRALKGAFPTKIFRVIFPFGRTSDDLRAAADETRKIKVRHLASAQLEDEIILANGARICRPDTWR